MEWMRGVVEKRLSERASWATQEEESAVVVVVVVFVMMWCDGDGDGLRRTPLFSFSVFNRLPDEKLNADEGRMLVVMRNIMDAAADVLAAVLL